MIKATGFITDKIINKIIWHNLPYWQLIVTTALWSCGYHSDAMEHIGHQMSFIHLLLITCRQELIWMTQRLNLHIRCIFSFELFTQKNELLIGHEYLYKELTFWIKFEFSELLCGMGFTFPKQQQHQQLQWLLSSLSESLSTKQCKI